MRAMGMGVAAGVGDGGGVGRGGSGGIRGAGGGALGRAKASAGKRPRRIRTAAVPNAPTSTQAAISRRIGPLLWAPRKRLWGVSDMRGMIPRGVGRGFRRIEWGETVD